MLVPRRSLLRDLWQILLIWGKFQLAGRVEEEKFGNVDSIQLFVCSRQWKLIQMMVQCAGIIKILVEPAFEESRAKLSRNLMNFKLSAFCLHKQYILRRELIKPIHPSETSAKPNQCVCIAALKFPWDQITSRWPICFVARADSIQVTFTMTRPTEVLKRRNEKLI